MQSPYIKKKVRKALKERANGKCERCGKLGLLELHHIKSWRSGGSSELDNLELICHDCHTNLKIANWQSMGKFKTLNVPFTDEEFALLEQAKGKLNWHTFIMMLTQPQVQHGIIMYEAEKLHLLKEVETE